MELLTTGQMIDQLKVGEIAESENGKYRVTHLFTQGFVYVDKNGNVLPPHGLRGHFWLTSNIIETTKWRILPKYVSFEEAMKAMKEGATVKCYPEKDDDGYIEFNEADTVHSVAAGWTLLSFGDLAYGRWIIE